MKSFHSHTPSPHCAPRMPSFSQMIQLWTAVTLKWRLMQRFISLNFQRGCTWWVESSVEMTDTFGFLQTVIWWRGGWKQSTKTIYWWIKSENRHLGMTDTDRMREPNEQPGKQATSSHTENRAVSQEAPLPAQSFFSLLVWPQHFPMTTFLWSTITIGLQKRNWPIPASQWPDPKSGSTTAALESFLIHSIVLRVLLQGRLFRQWN